AVWAAVVAAVVTPDLMVPSGPWSFSAILPPLPARAAVRPSWRGFHVHATTRAPARARASVLALPTMAAPDKETVEGLMARKNYARALELIQAHLARRPRDDRLRLQQADVLIAAGREKGAATQLMALADEQ